MSKAYYLLLVSVLFVLAGCAGRQAQMADLEKSAGQSVAVVSFAVNNYGFLGKGAIDEALIEDNIAGMLKETETVLAQRWTVKPAVKFIGNEKYRQLSIGDAKEGLVTPLLENQRMPSFTKDRRQIVKGVLDPSTAKQLCAALGVDSVILVYSEWTLDQGKLVPTIKALTKNCISMYNKEGKKLFFARKDVRGERVIGGAFAGVYINEETIGEWTASYMKGMKTIFKL